MAGVIAAEAAAASAASRGGAAAPTPGEAKTKLIVTLALLSMVAIFIAVGLLKEAHFAP